MLLSLKHSGDESISQISDPDSESEVSVSEDEEDGIGNNATKALGP